MKLLALSVASCRAVPTQRVEPNEAIRAAVAAAKARAEKCLHVVAWGPRKAVESKRTSKPTLPGGPMSALAAGLLVVAFVVGPLAQAPTDAEALAAARARLERGTVKLGSGVTNPRLIKETKPVYTAEARRRQLAGSVELLARIGVDGLVEEALVTRSLDPGADGLDQQALAAARQWTFSPARLNDVAVATVVTMILDFHFLDRAPAQPAAPSASDRSFP